ncbi:flagellin N-terminal helical domain-containing protein [Virgibacillus alimentarius]|uniref:flagellin N-terminal helical domain-containing protein n=1 Tax=Virgibacillus alimentarius TaxID=698769 RepID=UPI001CF72ABB|nr:MULTISPECIES: flagellin [Virgibacillus]HLR67051.1 flagellin [Virgibacillus sp.]
MIINHNIAALNTHRQLSGNNSAVQNSLEKLSSGLKINKAGDDAAGLAISEKMRGQIRGLEMAQKNAQDGISLIQTAEGALNETHSILQRMRELAVQSSNDTNTDSDRAELQKELDQLANALNDISADTEFNTQKLLDGNFKATFHVGANEGQDLSISINDMSAFNLGVEETLTAQDSVKVTHDGASDVSSSVLQNEAGNTVAVFVTDGYYRLNDLESNDSNDGFVVKGGATAIHEGDSKITAKQTVKAGIDISSQPKADKAITTIQTAIDSVSAERSKLGAVQNRLDHTINNLGTSAENLTAAESRIRDVDMAKEMMEFTKNNILSQAAQAMLAQANQQPQGVLQLLR